jgi:hypothetical protein
MCLLWVRLPARQESLSGSITALQAKCGQADPAELCEGLPQARQERRERCGRICEAVTRPSMRFVPIKTKEQQTALMLHRARQLLVRQRTMLSNALRGHLAELGIVSAKGRNGTSMPQSGRRPQHQNRKWPQVYTESALVHANGHRRPGAACLRSAALFPQCSPK